MDVAFLVKRSDEVIVKLQIEVIDFFAVLQFLRSRLRLLDIFLQALPIVDQVGVLPLLPHHQPIEVIDHKHSSEPNMPEDQLRVLYLRQLDFAEEVDVDGLLQQFHEIALVQFQLFELHVPSVDGLGDGVIFAHARDEFLAGTVDVVAPRLIDGTTVASVVEYIPAGDDPCVEVGTDLEIVHDLGIFEHVVESADGVGQVEKLPLLVQYL